MKKKLELQTTTLWDYPSQQYLKSEEEKHKFYAGATPSYIIWNLLNRYTKEKDLIVDPIAGSGTTIDVSRELNRRVLGYDINPLALKRKDIFKADARKIPIENEKVDFVFVDPPYSDHIKYSDEKNCIGKLSAKGEEYYKAMDDCFNEIFRIMKKDRYMALYVSDSYKKDYPFMAIGFKLFEILNKYFMPIDIISVVRHNKNLSKGNYHISAIENNYYLRGFNYLFIMYKIGNKTIDNNGKLHLRNL